jgi:ATP-binding cassette subfamily F protein 3
MDKVVTHTLGIHRKKTRKIAGDTGKYYTRIALEEEVYEKTRINDERKRKEVELFISRFRAKARLANMVQSRIKTLEKREKKDKIQSLKTLDFSFRSKPFHGKYSLTAQDISFSYTAGNELIKDFSLTIGAKDRICIVGKNGKGKTTLLRLLSGSLVPDQGEIIQNPNMTQGVFVQTNVSSLVDERTIEEEILYTHPDVDRQYSRNICGAMMFEGDEALKKIKVISGGEKSRVMLGKLLVKPVNLLLLDEPTNHLDMESCDALLAAIDSFNGAVVIVTHNEMFLHALAERLVIFDNNQITTFEGDYQSFLDRIGWSEEKESPLDEPQNEKETKITKKDLRKKRSEIITERSRTLRPLETKIEQVEKSIITEENSLAKLHQDLLNASQNNEGSKIGELSKSILITEQKINDLFDELQELTTSLDKKTQLFEQKFQQLEQELSQ